MRNCVTRDGVWRIPTLAKCKMKIIESLFRKKYFGLRPLHVVETIQIEGDESKGEQSFTIQEQQEYDDLKK